MSTGYWRVVQVIITAEGADFNVRTNAPHPDVAVGMIERAKYVLLAGSTLNIRPAKVDKAGVEGVLARAPSFPVRKVG